MASDAADGATRDRWFAAAVLAAVVLPMLAMHPVAYGLIPLKRSVLLIAGAGLLVTARGRQVLRRPMGGPMAWLGAFLVAYTISGFVSGGHWFLRTESVLQAVALVYLALAVRDVFWEHGEWMLRGLMLVAAVLAAISLLQVLGWDVLYGDGSARRPVATAGNSNAWAAWAAPVLVVVLGRATGSGRRALLGFAAIGLTASLTLAGGRGGWLAAAAGLAVVLWLAVRSGRSIRGVLVLLAIGGLGALLLPGARPAGGREVLGLERSSNVVRWEVARASLAEWREAPLLGHGPGQFAVEFPRFRTESEATTAVGAARSVVDQPHDEPLRVACEGGVLALLLLACGIGGCLWHLGRRSAAFAGDDGTTSGALLAGMVATVVVSLTWSNLWDPATAALTMFLLGGALASRVEFDDGGARRWLVGPVGWALAALLVLVAAPPLVGEFLQARALWTPLRESIRTGQPPADVEGMFEGLERAAALDPYSVERQAVIGELFLARSRQNPADSGPWLGRAAECFRRLDQVHPNHTGMLRAMAEIAVRTGSLESTRRWLQRLHVLEPWGAPVNDQLAALAERFGRGEDLPLLKWRRGDSESLAEVLAEVATLRERGDAQAAARILDHLAEECDAELEFHRENARCLQAIGDDVGYREAMRRAQLCCAVESLRLGELDVAADNLDRARRYVEAGQDEAEDLLEALVRLRGGSARDAVAVLETVAEGAARHVPDWVLAELEPLFDHPSTLREMRRIGVPLTKGIERRRE